MSPPLPAIRAPYAREPVRVPTEPSWADEFRRLAEMAGGVLGFTLLLAAVAEVIVIWSAWVG